MPLSVAYKNALLNATLPDAISLHRANPGSNGANEISGGTPAYARKSLSWGTASGGQITLSADPVFDVPAGETITHIGLWKAGVYSGYAPIASEQFSNQGTLTCTSGMLNLNANASA